MKGRRYLAVFAVVGLVGMLLGAPPAGAAPADPMLYHELTPARLLDTRPGRTTVDGVGAGSGAFSGTKEVVIAGRGGVPADGVGAVVLNVTAVGPSAAGYLTVFPDGTPRPNASNLNFTAGANVPVAVIAKVGESGSISVFASARTNVIVDVSGWFGDRSEYHSLNPARLVDTRPGRSTVDGGSAGGGAFSGTHTYQVIDRGGVPSTTVSSVVLNVTVTNPATSGYLSVFPDENNRPNASNVNFSAGQTVSNLVVAKIRGGEVSIFASARTDVIVDVAGWLPPESDYVDLNPARLVDTRPGRSTTDGLEAGGGSFAGSRSFDVVGRGGASAYRVGTVLLNITVTNPTADGFTTLYPTGTSRPNASNLNFTRGKTVANLVLAETGTDGMVSVYNSAAADVIIDIAGWLPGDGVGPIDEFEADAISAGGFDTCAVATGGSLKCWGENSSSQLGDSTTADSSTPVPVPDLQTGVASVAVGSAGHSCVLTTVGAMKCWGDNYLGQLGDGTNVQRQTPVTVSTLDHGVASISVGSTSTCAVTTAGAALCWGDNAYGQLGDGTTTDRWVPTAVSGLSSGVESISVGAAHTCAITTAGAALCWGYNAGGQIGDGTIANRWTPTPVVGLSSGAESISAGGGHTCALDSDAAALCWGYNESGQLGDGTMLDSEVPVAVFDADWNYRSISAGDSFTCALKFTGEVECWGANYDGNLGNGSTTDSEFPLAVSGLSSGVTAIDAGIRHACALTSTGTAKCWGDNSYGQLGDRSRTARSSPVSVAGT